MDRFEVGGSEASRQASVPCAGTVLLAGLSMLAAALAVVVVMTDAGPASAHPSGFQPSRASNGNIIVRCFSNNHCGTYDWSRGPWNNQPGSPSVVPDTSTNPSASLWIGEDYNNSTVDTIASWSQAYDPDRITNNNYYMNASWTTVGYKRVAATHEFGHSLGLGHAINTGEGDITDYCHKAVMFENSDNYWNCGQVGYVMPHDERDWVALWGTT